MGKELAAGFDLAAVFSEETVNRIFQLSYFGGLLPMHASQTFTHHTAEHTLELYFLAPTLQFISIPNVNNPVRIRFPFLAQVPTLNGQSTGAIVVVCTASKLQALEDTDEPFHHVVLDFTTVPANQFVFEPGEPADLPFHSVTTFSTLPPAIVADVAAPLASSVLKAGIERLPIMPRIPATAGFFTFRLHVDDSFVLPPDGTPYVLPRVMAAYVNFANEEGTPPSAPPLELRRRIAPHPHQASYTWAGADEIKVAVPETLVHERLQEALVEQELHPLPATLTFGDTSVTLHELSIALATGHLLVTGDADDVTFTLKVKLRFEHDAMQAIIIDKEFDVPWYLDMLQVLLPGIGSAIVHAIRLSIAKGLDSVGGMSSDLLSGLGMFSNELPGLQLAPLRIHHHGEIAITPSGFVLPGELETLLSGSSVDEPFYVYGHAHSREFHRQGAGCPYLEKMLPKNTVLFMSPAHALNLGYNGCRVCYLEYDAIIGARLYLHFRDLTPGGLTTGDTRTIAVEAELTTPLQLGDQQIQPTFTLNRKLKVRLENGALYFSDYGLGEFLPGTWRIRVSSEGWTTSCDAVVKKWGKVAGDNTHVAFTVGAVGGTQALGEPPPFPPG